MPGQLQAQNTNEFVQGLLGQIEQQRQAKQQMLQAMIQSGQYQPSTQPQPTTFMQRFSNNAMGPQLGSPNPMMGGQQFQQVTPQMRMQQLQQQMQAYGGLLGQPGSQAQPGQQGQLEKEVSIDPSTGQAKVTLKAKPQDQNVVGGIDFNKNVDDVKAEMNKKFPGLYKFAEAVKKGDMSIKDIPGYGKNGQIKLLLDQYLGSAYPGVNFDQRHQIKKDYSPGGPIGKQLTSSGTIVQHMYELKNTIDQLDSHSFKPWNQLMQTGSRATGIGKLAAVKKYDLLKNLLSSEYETYLRNGGSAEAGIERIINTMDEADPPEVQKQVLNEGANAMAGRLGNYVSGWYGAFNQPGDPGIPSTILNSKTRYALQKMGMGDVIKAVESPEGLAGITDNTEGQQQSNTGKKDFSSLWN